MFNYVPLADAVGMLYQEACVRGLDAKRDGDEAAFERWYATADAIQAAWPELVAKSVEKPASENES